MSYALPGGALRRAFHDAVRRSDIHPEEHWSFDAFPPPTEPWRPASWVCRLGSRTRSAHLPYEIEGAIYSPTLAFDEEYFEWITLLQAVLEAGPEFTFIELGAGHGRWTSRAAWACRHRGKRAHLVAAEAEPKHAAWFREHMQDNEITDVTLFEAAVGEARRRTALAIRPPEAEAQETEWFGQSIGWGDLYQAQSVGIYHGHEILQVGDWQFIEVDELPLADIIGDRKFINLIDMDVQGAEGVVIRSAIDLLTATTRRMYVETHSREVHAEVRDLMLGAGWRILHDFDFMQENDTPFGVTQMVGGVQCWINPRLAGRR